LLLPVDGKTYEVQFDDWMYLMNDSVMLNKSEMRKFGFKLGEIVISSGEAMSLNPRSPTGAVSASG
jgi:hypothetical protein